MIVAIDAAKYYQKALISNYFGDVLETPFFFGVNQLGIKDLCARIQKAKSSIQATKVFIGVEVTSHYYEDIVRELGRYGYEVTIINAATTHEERASTLNRSKTDDLDLYAIANAIRQNKGTENKLPEGNHKKIMTLTRARRTEVAKRSKARVHIRTLMDQIWREFQGYVEVEANTPRKKLIFSDFWGKSSMIFLEHFPHPSDVLALGMDGVREVSTIQKLKMREDTIMKLLFVAEHSIVKAKCDLSAELLLLQLAIKDLKRLNETITILEKEIEHVLLQTEGRLLLTVPGLGVVTAAEFYSELGDISNYENAGQLIKKAGTNPIIIQSGGTRGYFGRISKQGNKHLRFIVYTVGKSLAQHNKDLKPFFDRLRDKGKHARKAYIAMGNKFIKIAFSMLKHHKPYRSDQANYSYLSEIKKKLHHTKTTEFLKIVLAA
jgi:transposase